MASTNGASRALVCPVCRHELRQIVHLGGHGHVVRMNVSPTNAFNAANTCKCMQTLLTPLSMLKNVYVIWTCRWQVKEASISTAQLRCHWIAKVHMKRLSDAFGILYPGVHPDPVDFQAPRTCVEAPSPASGVKKVARRVPRADVTQSPSTCLRELQAPGWRCQTFDCMCKMARASSRCKPLSHLKVP